MCNSQTNSCKYVGQPPNFGLKQAAPVLRTLKVRSSNPKEVNPDEIFLLLCSRSRQIPGQYLEVIDDQFLPTPCPVNYLLSKYQRGRWPCDLRRWSAAARLLGLRIRIPPGAWMSVFCECNKNKLNGIYVYRQTQIYSYV